MALQPVPRPSRSHLTRRGRSALRILATVLLIAGALTLFLNLQGPDAEATGTPDDRRAETPLASARRAPGLFVDAAARASLEAAAQTFIASTDRCLAIDDGNPDNGVLVRVNGDVPLAPASTTKLLTAAAALHVLGADHRLTTEVLRVGDTLYLRGGGDPVLSTPAYEERLRETPRTANDVVTPLAQLADAIAAAGITEVESIEGDASRHNDVGFLDGWKQSYQNDVGELSALTVDDGTSGGVRVDDPALLAATQLGDLLTDRGVAVGGAGTGTTPAGATPVATIESPPVGDIVASMLSSSDNLTAELLVRELGGDGTTATGLVRAKAALEELAVPTAGLDLRDGSGLDAANRATCDAILRVLALDLEPIDRGLAVAGQSGTLVARLVGDPLAGVLRAKTGQIDGVAGLAGVVDDAERLDFAFIVNADFSTSGGQALQVGAARVVAEYPVAPEASALVPPP